MASFSAFTPRSPLVLVGAGKMGSALLDGWLAGGLDGKAVIVIDPAPSAESVAFLSRLGIRPLPAPPANVRARAVVVAVKPQIIANVLPPLRPLFAPTTLAVSIAAGTPLAKLAAGLGEVAIVRAMPNTPAQIGRGIAGAIGNAKADAPARALATDLLAAVGDVVWLDDEGLIDAVTAVSGSGPAYVFLLAECLAEAAVDAGLPTDVAAALARATVTGSAELLRQSAASPAKLRADVTSPNGTTAAALAVLMAPDGMAALMKRAVAAAKKRSRDLAG